MKVIQEKLLEFLEKDTKNEDDFHQFTNFLADHHIKNRFWLEFLNLISKISSNHHQTTDFNMKIDNILKFFKDDIKQNITNYSLFNTFKNNKRLLLFFIEEKILIMDDLIYKKIMNQIDLLDYFLPETISYLTKQEKEVEKEFAENRRNGANHSEICRLIQKDLDQDFNSYINENNIPLFLTKINHSKFETNSFLLAKQEELTIIEYAAFCGSFKIFCYMQEKGAICDQSIWIYAIHGNNLNILKKLIKDGIIPNDESYKECFEESIKCYHNEIAKYIHENLMKENSINIEKLIDLNNFEFIPSNLDKESLFNCFCRNGYLYLVESLINNIDVNKKVNEKTAL